MLSLGLDSSADSGRSALPAGIDVGAAGAFRAALAQATVAVVAGGTTLYEACALGTPVVAVPVVPGQTTTVRRFVRAGLAAGVRGRGRRAARTRGAGRSPVAALDLLADASRRGESCRAAAGSPWRAAAGWPRGCEALRAGARALGTRTRARVTGTTAATMRIGTRSIGGGAPLFVIAEIGLNHGGRSDRALALVDAAAGAGASAVKLQSLRGRDARRARSARRRRHPGARRRAVAARLLRALRAGRGRASRASPRGPASTAWPGSSSPFDEAAVDMLERLDCDALKIASGDITHHRLIARAAATGKPLVISTGLSTLDEVAAAVTLRPRRRRAGASRCCTACRPIPTPDDQQNLGAIRTLATVFGLPVGLSDHTGDAAGVAAAVALGASLYERHVKASDDRSRDRRGGVVVAGGARAAGRRSRRETQARLGSGAADAAAGRAGEPAGQPPRALCRARSGGRHA